MQPTTIVASVQNAHITSLRFSLLISLILCVSIVSAQPGRNSRPIVLNPEDTAAFAHAPSGFDQVREGILRGRTDSVQYASSSVGSTRKLLIYTPPGFTPQKKYPVLYLMHGIGGDEKEWYKYCAPNVILDNLYADHRIVAMIVVFPNGRAMKNDSSGGDIFTPEKIKAFGDFEKDLLT